MKIQFLKSIIFISLLFQILGEIPVWDFNNISIDLLSSNILYEYTIYNKTLYNTTISLIKSITNVAGTIVAENYLTVNSTRKPVNFENIDSFYINKLGSPIIICPKGKFHPYDFKNNTDIVPPEFEEDGNWDLKCYYHETGFFLIFYLMNNNKNFYYSLNDSNEITKCENCFYTYIYDFKIEDGNQNMNYYYKFPCVRDDAGYLRFDGKNILLNIQNNRVALTDYNGVLEIIQSKTNTQAYFDENNNLYFFTYSNIFDFTSGYVVTKYNLTDNSEYTITDCQINTNTSSPFLVFDFNSYIKIKEMSFIPGTNFVYYIINYENDNKFYYGLVDIKLNQLIYNIENEFTSFLPYSKNEMLAISSSSAYLICIAKNGNSCIKECPYDKLFIENGVGNTCQDYCDAPKIKLMPEGICINKEDCDLNIYSLNNEEKVCGLCSYFYPNGEKYKLINSTYCLSYMPNNTEFYNEELLLLKCKTNYHLEGNECIPDFCYETCNSCSQIPNDINNQYCLSCKEGYNLDNGNCIINATTCPEGSFLGEDNLCYNCTNECKNYKENICNCSSCHNGFYIDDNINKCRKCDKICDIYEENSCLCESCPINYELINKNCIECTGCKFSEISHCNCSICHEGYYLDNYKCKKCDEQCLSYKENTCICDSQYSFYGHYYGTNESINLFKTDNLTNIENIILQKLQSKLNMGEINLLYLDAGKYFFAEALETKFIIYKSKEEEENDIKIKIDLGECEDKLKANKSLSQNISLYILYIQKDEEGMEIPKTGYEIYYYKSNQNIYEKMDLGVCKNMKINKSVYINISDDDIDKYNSSSGYYNDICYTYTSGNGTDVTLKDRRNEYINNNMAVCEENCDFIAYDSDTSKAICSCPISESISQVSDMKFDKEKLKSNFINFKNIANIEMLKCYHLLFSSKIIKNIGCIIISIIILIELVNMILFYSYENNLFHKKIKDIFEAKLLESKENKLNVNNIKGKDNKHINNNTDEIKIFEKKIGDNKKKSKKRIRKKSKARNKKKNKTSKSYNKKQNQNPPKKVLEKNSTNNMNNTNNIINNNQTKNMKNLNFEKKIQNNSNKVLNSLDNLTLNEINSFNNEKNNKLNNEIMKYIDMELNLLPYQAAINDDKRTYYQYYVSLLRTKHLLVFSFFNKKDYNSLFIKINLFFFTFSVNYTINALFFNDSTMHKIYEDGGKFNFIYQIPQILYSSIISTVLIMLVKFLALSEKNILKIKNSKENELTKIYKSETKTIKYKFICFFIIIYILLLTFWYYVGCFCAIYKNTQIHLLTDTLISFATSLSYPLGLYLIPGIFRISSLKDKNNKSEYLYNFSKMIQLFV